MPEHRLLIITPVRNEAAHIEAVANALAAQERRPEHWLVVDDGSDDETPQIIHRLTSELDFMHVVSTPPGFTAPSNDRLKVAAAPRAFNYGLHTIDPRELSLFTHLGKLDGDVELRPDYFVKLLAEFDRNPRLGIGGGVVLEQHGGEWAPTSSAPEHVRGALKLYTRECFAAIGGIWERLGWDGIDEVTARMHGFETRSFEQAEALHHRHTGSADGRLRGHVRWGEAHWILHHGLPWTVMRRARSRGSSRAAPPAPPTSTDTCGPRSAGCRGSRSRATASSSAPSSTAGSPAACGGPARRKAPFPFRGDERRPVRGPFLVRGVSHAESQPWNWRELSRPSGSGAGWLPSAP